MTPRPHARGFTLYEALAALVLAAVVLPVTMQAVSLATNGAANAESHTSRIFAVKSPSRSIDLEGTAPAGPPAFAAPGGSPAFTSCMGGQSSAQVPAGRARTAYRCSNSAWVRSTSPPSLMRW